MKSQSSFNLYSMEAKDIEDLSVSRPLVFSLLRILCLDLPSIFKLGYLFSGPAGDGEHMHTGRTFYAERDLGTPSSIKSLPSELKETEMYKSQRGWRTAGKQSP